MIPSTYDYQEEMKKAFRGQTHIKIEYGAASEAEILSDEAYPSKIQYASGTLASTYNGIDVTSNYAYFRDGCFKTNGAQKFVADDYADNDPNCGFMPYAVSLAEETELGYMYVNKDTDNPDIYYQDTHIQLNLVDSTDTELKTVEGFVIKFDSITGIYATQIRVVAQNEDVVVFDQTYTNDSTEFIFEEELINITKIIVYPLYINKPETLLRITEIFLGINIVYTEKELDQSGFSFTRSVSLLSNELSYNELSFTVNNIEQGYNPFTSTGIYKYFDTMQPVTLYIGREIDDEIYYLKVAKLLTDEITFSDTTYTISCVDMLSTLSQINYYTKYHESAINTTWEDMVHEVLYNIDVGITSDDIIFTDKLKNGYCTSQGFAVSTKELLQLISNINNHVVYTNRNGQIEFIDAWIPSVTVTDNGHYDLSSVQAAYDTIELPEVAYSQYTTDYQKTSDSANLLFAPDDTSELKLLGYIGNEIATSDGTFTIPPTITIKYSLPTSIDSLYLVFDHLRQEYPTSFTVNYYDSNDLVILTKEYTENTYFEINESIDIDDCVKFVITINKWSVGEHRAIVNRIGNGRISDYYLDYDNILSNPSITKSDYVKEINSKYHTYTKDGSELQEVYQTTIYGNGLHSLYSDSPYWFTYIEKVSGDGTIDAIYNAYSNAIHFDVSGNTSGMVVSFKGLPLTDLSLSQLTSYNSKGTSYSIDNPFCTTPELAAKLNDWYYDYVKKGQKLTISYRGEPTLEPFDFIYIQTQYQEKIPCVITKTTLDYNGSLSGTLEVTVV